MMNRKSTKGVAIIEFTLCMLVLVPMLLGTIGIGIQLIQTTQVIQLARDAGRLYGTQLNLNLAGNRAILAALGSGLGLHTAAGDTGGNSVLILTTLKYINAPGTVNHQHWVFAQRLVIGNSSYRTSNFGSPLVVVDPHFSAVTLDADGNVSPTTQMTDNPNDQANFTAQGNPFVSAGVLTDLPANTVLYVTEAAARGARVPPFASGGMMYAYNVF